MAQCGTGMDMEVTGACHKRAFPLYLTAGECHEVKWISVTDIMFTQIWGRVMKIMCSILENSKIKPEGSEGFLNSPFLQNNHLQCSSKYLFFM